MKCIIDQDSPDGLTLKIEHIFHFETYDEVMDFIKGVDKLYNKTKFGLK